MFRTSWLNIQEHPSEDALFALPNGIYFLIKFRQDWKHSGCASLDERMSIYFWWTSVGHEEYPDFSWQLRPQDKFYLENLSLEELVTLHPRSIELWLRGNAKDFLSENTELINYLAAPINFENNILFPIPLFLFLISQTRTDIQLTFDLTKLEGRLGLLKWWGDHGEKTYLRISWSASEWLESRVGNSKAELFAVPLGILLLLNYRLDRSEFGIQSLEDRIKIYIWWCGFGFREYPDLAWTIRFDDIAYIQNINIEEWVCMHSSSIELWLRSDGINCSLNSTNLLEHLYRQVNSKDICDYPLPRFLLLIYTCRSDLRGIFNISTYDGWMGLLDWWDRYGQLVYAKIKWETQTWLYTYENDSEAMLFAVPRGITYLALDRLGSTNFDIESLYGRLNLYFWWTSVNADQYSALFWKLRSQDIEFLKKIEAAELFQYCARGLIIWFGSPTGNELDKKKELRDYLLENIETEDHGVLPIPRFLLSIFYSRIDLQKTFDLTEFDGRMGLLNWWDRYGQSIYKKIEWSAQTWLNSHESNSEATLFAVPRGISYLARACQETTEFGIKSLHERLNLYFWWTSIGENQYSSLLWKLRSQDIEFLNKIEAAELFQYCARGLDLWFCSPIGNELDKKKGLRDYLLENIETGNHSVLSIPRFLLSIVHSRLDLQRAFDLTDLHGVLSLLEWWTIHGQGTYLRVQWSVDSLLRTLCTPYILEVSDEKKSLPLFLFLIWRDRPDLQSTIDLFNHNSSDSFISWWNLHGKVEYPLFSGFEIKLDYENYGSTRYTANLVKKNTTLPGVNIVGFPQGVLGLGEDARMSAKAMELALIPCGLINAPINGPQRVDDSMNHLITDIIKYPVTLFCLPPTEMMRLPLEGGVHLIDSDVHKIGAWPWELPHWPVSFSRVRQFVNEIWAQSDYVKSAFSRNSDTPVFKMPMAVSLPVVTENSRKRFGLHENHFLFYILFDGKSWLTRKNPLAGIQAFQLAFPKKHASVGLVVKAMNIVESDPMWQQILAIAKADERISILTELLPRQDAINLMASCDCYISLHRSEGFGRVIAEAMLLGQPVIVTNFSGNVDYCDQETSFLVDGDLIPLLPGEYLFHEGQYWCDPDISVAAEKMRLVFENVTLREQVCLAGQQRIIRDYSIPTVAAAYSMRLRQIADIRSAQ